MADFVKWVGTTKKAALDAVEATKPVRVFFGTVTTVAPLEIQLDQKLSLKAAQLVLTRNVTDFTVEMTVEHTTEAETQHTHPIRDSYSGGGVSDPTTHQHAYAGRKEFTVHNGLTVGDKVVLLREQGGQRFIVLDRLGVM